MQVVYNDLGITITPGSGSNTSDDLVSFKLAGTGDVATITNDLRYQPDGVQACATSLGVKSSGQLDFTVIMLPHSGSAAAVFSQSRIGSDCVVRNRACISDGALQAVAVSSGNANVFTPNGRRDVDRIAQLLEQEFQIPPEHLLISQTGLIGVPVPIDKFEAGIPHLAATLEPRNLDAASQAILTSDLSPKVASIALGDLVIAGIAKGSGMVEPNMATMLAYFFTNARVTPDALQAALTEAVNASLNCISIDGDMSTNDTAAILSTHALPLSEMQTAQFRQALTALCVKLARDLVSQGEGVTKMMEVTVDSDVSSEYSQRLAKKVCNSILVKAGLHGGQPMWGRVIAAMGKSEEAYADDPRLMPDQVEIRIQGQPVYRRGEALDVDTTSLKAALRTATVVHLHVTTRGGGFVSRAWGCDLSPAYIDLNAGITT